MCTCCGMKDLKDYVRSDATKFRDYLFAKGLNGASVARIFGTVRAVINLGNAARALEKQISLGWTK